ncbi:hypothetical protein BT63DRAFT_159365 [Microthyrium microscopicum]|uniref:Uncharacterized protein n=1 Tax=Microthyrium microscopicum TaxID=703497 RepID=A0A6A6UMN2_9PEZI|nr:hypothetical protein BT63DRAFT_159365 [Microthyrium microscopicum]
MIVKHEKVPGIFTLKACHHPHCCSSYFVTLTWLLTVATSADFCRSPTCRLDLETVILPTAIIHYPDTRALPTSTICLCKSIKPDALISLCVKHRSVRYQSKSVGCWLVQYIVSLNFVVKSTCGICCAMLDNATTSSCFVLVHQLH